jgi:formate dehydrogenase subunit gamma
VTATASRRVLRYRLVQRLLHWMGATGFIVLLVTGSILVWTPHIPIGTCCATRQLHRIAAILFCLWPVLYAVLDRAGLKEMIRESVTYTRDDLRWFAHSINYFFGRVHNAPPQGRINAGQKIHHLGVIVLSLGIATSGLVMWIGQGRLGPTLLPLVALMHDLSMLGLTVLTVGHVYFTLLYGGLDAMLKGTVTEEYARMEHAKWLVALPESAFISASPTPALPVARISQEPASSNAAAVPAQTQAPIAQEAPQASESENSARVEDSSQHQGSGTE